MEDNEINPNLNNHEDSPNKEDSLIRNLMIETPFIIGIVISLIVSPCISNNSERRKVCQELEERIQILDKEQLSINDSIAFLDQILSNITHGLSVKNTLVSIHNDTIINLQTRITETESKLHELEKAQKMTVSEQSEYKKLFKSLIKDKAALESTRSANSEAWFNAKHSYTVVKVSESNISVLADSIQNVNNSLLEMLGNKCKERR